MILLRLCVRLEHPSVGVKNSDRIRDNVEDRLELRDAAGEIFTETFSLSDVVAGEEKSAIAACAQRSEGGLDQPATNAMLEWNARRRDGHPADGTVNLIREVSERVRK